MISGTVTVSRARSLLEEAGVFAALSDFDPRWVGSIPLDIHGPGADVDIACSAGPDLEHFAGHLTRTFGAQDGYVVEPNTHAGENSIIARFTIRGLPFEIYGRSRPVETHESYVHWLAEHRLLTLAGPPLRTDVRAAKRFGLKTEPAFARCLKLGGDPYVEVLKLASPSDEALRQIISQAGYPLA